MPGSWFYNSFRPLVFTPAGAAAAERFGLPRFIDGSCRREPDFQSEFPSISALCRAGKFAPRLQVGDTVIYVTNKGWWQRRFVAVLRVRERFSTHEDAALWYRGLGLPLPSNCMAGGNDPIPYEQTVQDQLDLARWNSGYKARARAHPVFVATDALYCNVDDPPALTDTMLDDALGRRPGTQNPPRITEAEALRLLGVVGVEVLLPVR
jgi:hypothetical protein